MAVKTYIALIVLIGISELVLGDVCKLDFEQKKESKWTKFQREVVKKLSFDVTYDCNTFTCETIKDTAPVEKSNKTGCRCAKETEANGEPRAYDCRCCFKVKRWNFLFCFAAALELKPPFKFSIFVTIDGKVIARFNLPLMAIADTYIPVCIPALLPPPVHWLSPCFKFKFEVPENKNNFTWRICGKIKIGIFIVPIMTIYTKCFVISQQINLMTMEGQTSYDEEVETPATVKIKDPKNYDACMCLSNKQKADAIASASSRTGGESKDRILLDTKINWQETSFENAPFLVLLHTGNHLLQVQDLHDDDEFDGLQELVQEAQENQWMSQTGEVYDYPGGSCGGALLTADKVLTICACVRTFYAAHKLKKNFNDDNDDEEVFQFDIASYEIHLKFADPALSSSTHLLDTNDTMIISGSECSNNIEKSAPPEMIKTSMIVMPITPAIVNPNDIFVSWPPGPFPTGETVRMVAYGMEVVNMDWMFKDSSGKVIDFPNTAVEFYLKNCDRTGYCEKELGNDQPLSGPVKNRTQCVCAENSGHQLFGGEIGFPLTLNRQLYGLTSLPVDNTTEGSTLGTIFDPKTIKEIENYVGIDNLHSSTANPTGTTSNAPTSSETRRPNTMTTGTIARATKTADSVGGAVCRKPLSLIQFVSFIAVLPY